MSDWDTHSAVMDEVVDERLGDTISYSLDGVTFTDLKGFVLPFGESIGLDGIDPTLGTRWRGKIRKTLVAEPLGSHRLRHPKLGADTWRPAADDPENQGRYWLFDIQKVSA